MQPLFRRTVIEGVEHRRDPLSGSWTRINPERAHRVKHGGAGPPGEDLARLIEGSRKTCPFCPERLEETTPTFPPGPLQGGRLRKGRGVLFPNKNAYGENHAVGTLTDAHFLPMDAYREEILEHSLDLAETYFLCLHRADPTARYPVYVWNFLPPSAGSIVHPHVQLLLERMPAPVIRDLTNRCLAWRERHGEAYWQALVRAEALDGERLVHRDESIVVLASFAPRGFREILLLLPGARSLAELQLDQKRAFCRTLVRLLAAYHAMGVGSFNLVTYSPPIADPAPAFPFHAKLISRPYPTGIYTNDTGFFERMYDLWIIDTLPEDVAAAARPFLEGV